MKVKPVLKPDESSSSGFSLTGEYEFICPGCKDIHRIPTKPGPYSQNGWGFNGDVNKPTFTPSLLVRSGHYAPHHKPEDECWCIYNKEQREKGLKEASFQCYQCHSFIRDGKIEFLSDCSHDLRGQTVELPEIVG